MRPYIFPCGLGIESMKNSSDMIYKDNKLLKTQKSKSLYNTYTTKNKTMGIT